MRKTGKYQKALGQLREALALSKEGNPIYEDIVKFKDPVLERFQLIFAPDHLSQLTEEEFRSFLPLSNNYHWSCLQMQGKVMCSDMGKLRKSLTILLDEDRPIDKRYNESTSMVKGLGRAVATAILLVAYPEKYGVWNNTSKGGLKSVGLWPEFERGESPGKRYVKINELLCSLAADLKIDLWTLDALWWQILKKNPKDEQKDEQTTQEDQLFGLEPYLHEFLIANWEKTELSKEWKIYSEEGEDLAGSEYYCPGVGKIDILAQHRSKPQWLVIELKRGQSGDDTVGQVSRYMGWVMKHMAKPEEGVKGLVIAHEADKKLLYALVAAPNTDLKLYDVSFCLRKSPGLKAED